jgi:hypothetical protein
VLIFEFNSDSFNIDISVFEKKILLIGLTAALNCTH